MAKKYFHDQQPDGWGAVPPSLSKDVFGLTAEASTASTVLFTLTNTGMYAIFGDLAITTAGTGGTTPTILLSLIFKDETGTTLTASGTAVSSNTLGLHSAVVSATGTPLYLYLTSGTTISYSTTFAGTAGTLGICAVHTAVLQLS